MEIKWPIDGTENFSLWFNVLTTRFQIDWIILNPLILIQSNPTYVSAVIGSSFITRCLHGLYPVLKNSVRDKSAIPRVMRLVSFIIVWSSHVKLSLRSTFRGQMSIIESFPRRWTIYVCIYSYSYVLQLKLISGVSRKVTFPRPKFVCRPYEITVLTKCGYSIRYVVIKRRWFILSCFKFKHNPYHWQMVVNLRF